MDIYFTDQPLLGPHIRSYETKIVCVGEGDHSLVIDDDTIPVILHDEVYDGLEGENEDDWAHRIALGDSFIELKGFSLKGLGDNFGSCGTIKVLEVILHCLWKMISLKNVVYQIMRH